MTNAVIMNNKKSLFMQCLAKLRIARNIIIYNRCVCSTASVKIDKNRLETDGLDGRLRFLPIGNAGDE